MDLLVEGTMERFDWRKRGEHVQEHAQEDTLQEESKEGEQDKRVEDYVLEIGTKNILCSSWLLKQRTRF